MQASKIKIGTTYAVEDRITGKLSRFTVTAVITRRESAHGNPHDYKSTVEGYVTEPGQPRDIVDKKPEALLGEFTEYAELVERKRKEAEQQKAADTALRQRTLDSRLELYKFVGVEAPEKTDDYHQPFRVRGYAQDSVEINPKGVDLILEAFRAMHENVRRTA